MRRYDDPVEVRKGLVAGLEGPEQFLWRDRLWQVREVVATWVETGPWWRPDRSTQSVSPDLVAEKEVWRVVAIRGRHTSPGVFDLVLDWSDGSWRLAGCLD